MQMHTGKLKGTEVEVEVGVEVEVEVEVGANSTFVLN